MVSGFSRFVHLASLFIFVAGADALLAAPLDCKFNFQGQLKLDGGVLDGQVDFRVSLFDVDAGGIPLAGKDVANVTVTNGLFSIELDLGTDVFNGDPRWIELAVRSPHDPTNSAAYTTLAPRQPVTSTPYSIHTRGVYVDATGQVGIGETKPEAMLHLGGAPGIDGVKFPDGSMQTSAPGPDFWSLALNGGPNDIFYDAGNVGIGAESSGARLDVRAFSKNAILAQTSSSLSNSSGVEGKATSISGATYGGLFTAASTAGRGVYAKAFSSSGTNYGIYGETSSSSGYAGYFKGGRNYFEGRVGIGTNNPISKLHVVGPDDPADGPILTLSSALADRFEGGRIRFIETTSNLRGAYIHYNGLLNRLYLGMHNLGNGDPNDDVNAISISRLNGHVGIGRSAASWPLHVTGLSFFEDSIKLKDTLEVFDQSTNLAVELKGTSGVGSVRVENDNNSASALLTGSGSGSGAELNLRATDGTLSARLLGNGNGDGGQLRLTNDSGITTIDLQGDDGFDDNSSNILLMNSGNLTVELDGLESGGGVVRVNSNSSGGSAALLGDGYNVAGELELKNSLGARTVRVYGDETDAGGANFYYQDGTTIGIELDVEGWSSEAAISLFNADGFETVRIVADESSDGGDIRLTNALGQETCQLDADYSGTGESRLRVDVVEILGGADLSEQFDIRSNVGDAEPGMVVSIDSDRIGELVVSTTPYDRTVAGIISGAGGVKPGLLMGQRNTPANGAHAVALTGRVWVQSTAENGAIQAGDLLTTSSVAGHAMKVTDYAKAQGAIIGKAMSSLPSGRGLVLVLVSLQ